MRPLAAFASLVAALVFPMTLWASTPVHAPTTQVEDGRRNTEPAAGTQAVSEAGSGARRPPRAWTRVRIPDPHVALIVRRILDGVFRLLAEPRCHAILEEFRDEDGRPLNERLATFGLGVQRYLEFVFFEDGSRCAQCGDTVAYTAPGSRVVYVCIRVFEREWRQNRGILAAKLIHEVLHTLGLGENPPSSAEITARVLERCGRY
jgi:hypothetical protein